MEKRYQVFISSTFQDLKNARQEVSQALLRADCFPAGMELFPAADEEQFEFIKTIIDQSDYYILISAGRYGSIHPETGLSYTEMEYDYAVEIGVPIIRLLHRDPLKILTGEFIETTQKGRKSLLAFRKKLSSQSLIKFWDDRKELGQHVILGLLEAQKRRPALGWVRSNDQSSSENRVSQIMQQVLSMLDQAESSNLTIPNEGQIDKRDMSKEFIKNQRMSAFEQLASGIAKDFEGSLGPIRNHCELLLLRREIHDTDYNDLVQISMNANRATALVDQLRALSKTQTMNKERFDVLEVLSNLRHLLNRLTGEKVKLTISPQNDVPDIYADIRQFETVIMHLVVNARDAMPEGGTIQIQVMQKVITSSLQNQGEALQAGNYVTISVHDEGVGIPSKHLDRIFDPFFSTKDQKGRTALGLSSCYGIMKQSGGSIIVESELGKGSQFTLYYPAS
jgi:signal transduction histidine kinase